MAIKDIEPSRPQPFALITTYSMRHCKMKVTVEKLLIALLAIAVYHGGSVQAEKSVKTESDQVAQESNSLGTLTQSFETPKLVTAKPETLQMITGHAKINNMPYPSHISKQQLLMMHYNKMKKAYANQKPPYNKSMNPKVVKHHHYHHAHHGMMSYKNPSVGNSQQIRQPLAMYGQTQHKLNNAPSVPVTLKPVNFVPSKLVPQIILGKTKALESSIYQIHNYYPSSTVSSRTEGPTTTTTQRPRRVKRIWPKDLQNYTKTNENNTNTNQTINKIDTNVNNTQDNLVVASSNQIRKTLHLNKTINATTLKPQQTKVPNRHARKPVQRSTSPAPTNATKINMTDDGWIPIVPRHYPPVRRGLTANRRAPTDKQAPGHNRRSMYLPVYGYIPSQQVGHTFPLNVRVPRMINKPLKYNKNRLNANYYSGFSGIPVALSSNALAVGGYGDVLDVAESRRPVLTKIKHHHHHHHHKYIKTVEKPIYKKIKVPVKVTVPKPYPVEKKVFVPVEKVVEKIIERKVPYPVEKKVPYAVEVKVPQPYPVKVVEKEYIPRPYPVLKEVPIIKHVEVKVPHPVPYEKRIPYPVEVKVPVEKHINVPVHIEKQVPVPYPVKVFIPQPITIEKKVPYPVEVKVREPVHIVKPVPYPVKVFVEKPVPVKVPEPVPVTIEKKVPYPVEVEKKIHIPVRVYVPVHTPVDDTTVSHQHTHYYPPQYHFPQTSESPLSNNLRNSENHQVSIHGNGSFRGFAKNLLGLVGGFIP